jgi:predicted alpha/beta hydrolase
VLAFGFDDDDYAPPAAVDALLSLYDNARVTRRQVSRAEARVGHFGFFRERFRATFWEEAAAFLAAAHADAD